MSDEYLNSKKETDDKTVKHGSYTIKRPGAEIRLNDNDSEFEDDRTEIRVGSTTDNIGSPKGVQMQVAFNDGGLQEAFTGVSMTPEQARGLAERLEKAADAYLANQRKWF